MSFEQESLNTGTPTPNVPATPSQGKSDIGSAIYESLWNTAPVDYWTIATATQFNRDDWEQIISWNEFRTSVPREPQTPPAYVKNSDKYEWIIDGSQPPTVFIPDIKMKSQAKTDTGRKEFHETMAEIWADRKRLFLCGTRLLRDANFFKHSKDVLGQVDSRTVCPRCGCTVFASKDKKNLGAKCPPATIHEKLTCYDCEYAPRERTYRIKWADIATDENYGLHFYKGRNPPLPRLTPREFVAALLIDGRLGDVADAEERRKISSSYLQLCQGWLPADVKNEPAYATEQESAIRQRAARLLRVLREHEEASKPLPTPSAGEFTCLKERIEATEVVT